MVSLFLAERQRETERDRERKRERQRGRGEAEKCSKCGCGRIAYEGNREYEEGVDRGMDMRHTA